MLQAQLAQLARRARQVLRAQHKQALAANSQQQEQRKAQQQTSYGKTMPKRPLSSAQKAPHVRPLSGSTKSSFPS
ncbi:MAG: hypothetical protein RSB86_19360 [Comamonas sp.]|uniref:hypothetical protein n=1 Tax=Comamonas sp. TaxID=34028 RepID=UPI002FC9A8C3